MPRDTILLVDDDPSVREILREYLKEQLVWRVVEADSVVSATNLFRAEISRIAIIISDDHMGGFGKNGADLFLQRSLDLHLNNIPFVLMSGSNDPLFSEIAKEFGMVPVQKPVRLKVLGALLHTLILDMDRPKLSSGER